MWEVGTRSWRAEENAGIAGCVHHSSSKLSPSRSSGRRRPIASGLLSLFSIRSYFMFTFILKRITGF